MDQEFKRKITWKGLTYSDQIMFVVYSREFFCKKIQLIIMHLLSPLKLIFARGCVSFGIKITSEEG